MEQTRIVIIGAGPAGLVLALSLAQQEVTSIILERESEVTQDPRGVYLAGDANRILANLGLGSRMPQIGHEASAVHFHTSSFAKTPFLSLDTTKDALQQAVPTGVFMIQPELEKALRAKVIASSFCDLRVGCDVQSLKETATGTEIGYIAPDGSSKRLQTAWLIGADGKKGIVRKTYLEPLADIRQVESGYRYEGTWIAANLKISVPTPETHPDFAPWKLGLTADEVYDLFWPKDWHFCSPPGKPTASGRFGPLERRLWRHEFKQEDWDGSTMDADELFWEHITPMITRTVDAQNRRFGTAVTFPRDCIEILRCRPFTFAHKVVNKWHYKKTVVIGDAAHVFPPFGGQGIASGVRDAHQLAWRIAALERQSIESDTLAERMLSTWATERTQSIRDAAQFTKLNGRLCNNQKPPLLPVMQAVEWFSTNIMGSSSPDPQAQAERRGFHGLRDGFFLNDHGGGRRLPQIYVDTLAEKMVLSDSIFGSSDSPLRLLVFHRNHDNLDEDMAAVKDMLADASILRTILSPESIVAMNTTPCALDAIRSSLSAGRRKVSPTSMGDLRKREARAGYDVAAFQTRLGKETKYAIVRPDFYVFATAKNVSELKVCFKGLRAMLEGDEMVESSC